MAGVNYMGGKRSAARTRAKDITSRIQKGFFRKQKLASLSKAQAACPPAGVKDAEPISLSHATHRRDSRGEAPTISLHVKRTNTTSSRTDSDQKGSSGPKYGGRAEVLDALETTEPTLLRGLLNRVLATPDLAGLSTRKRKRSPPPPYTPVKRRRAEAQEGPSKHVCCPAYRSPTENNSVQVDRHTDLESPDSSYVVVSSDDQEEDATLDDEGHVIPARTVNPFDTSEDESEPSQTEFVANYRTSTCSEHRRTSSTNLTSPLFAVNCEDPAFEKGPENIFDHEDPWRSIGHIIGLHEQSGAALQVPKTPLAAWDNEDAHNHRIDDDDDGWIERASSPSALSPAFEPPCASNEEHTSCKLLDLSYAQELSSRPPSSLASTSSHSLNTSIFRESAGEKDQQLPASLLYTSSPASRVERSLVAPSHRRSDNEAGAPAHSDASVLSSMPARLTRSSAPLSTRLFLSSVYSPRSTCLASRHAPSHDSPGREFRTGRSEDDLHPQGSSSSSNVRFGAMSQLISEAPSPSECRPRTRKPFYGHQHSMSTSSPLRIPVLPSTPLRATALAAEEATCADTDPILAKQPPFSVDARKFTETIPSRDVLVHYAPSSPYRSPRQAGLPRVPALGEPLPALASSPASRPRLRTPTNRGSGPEAISSVLLGPRLTLRRLDDKEPDTAAVGGLGPSTPEPDYFAPSPEGSFLHLRPSGPRSPWTPSPPALDLEQGSLLPAPVPSELIDDGAVVRQAGSKGAGVRASSAVVCDAPMIERAEDPDLSSALLIAAGKVPTGSGPEEADGESGRGLCLFFEDDLKEELDSDE
ncbi:hypothetical protein HDZ31DRAFT_28411 [Schizophyllum fasciatum]